MKTVKEWILTISDKKVQATVYAYSYREGTLDSTAASFSEAIKKGFTWGLAAEGVHYWAWLSKQY